MDDPYVKKVLELHHKLNFSIDLPLSRDRLLENRLRFIEEEYREFREAIDLMNQKEILKELSDLLYVLFGFAVAYGLPVAEAFERVHESNMSKSPASEPDGKATKGDGYKPANLDDLVEYTNRRKTG